MQCKIGTSSCCTATLRVTGGLKGAGAESILSEIRAQSLAYVARLLHCQLAPAERQASTPVLDLAADLMSAGVNLAGDQEALLALKRYLPGLLKALSTQSADARYLKTACLLCNHTLLACLSPQHTAFLRLTQTVPMCWTGQSERLTFFKKASAYDDSTAEPLCCLKVGKASGGRCRCG